MSKPVRLVNWLVKACSLAAGGAVFYAFGNDLIASDPELASSSFGYYIVLVTDLMVSLIGSAMLAYLLYFCLWDCFFCTLMSAVTRRKY